MFKLCLLVLFILLPFLFFELFGELRIELAFILSFDKLQLKAELNIFLLFCLLLTLPYLLSLLKI